LDAELGRAVVGPKSDAFRSKEPPREVVIIEGYQVIANIYEVPIKKEGLGDPIIASKRCRTIHSKDK